MMVSNARVESMRRIPLVGIALLLTTSAAVGEPTEIDRATAQRLFDEAMALMQKQQYQPACPKFEESQRLAPAMGTQFNLAECFEKTERVASAWILFNEVAEAAQRAGRADRETFARQRAEAVAPKVSFVTIKVTSPSGGMTLQCDTTDIAPSRWGTPIPTDSGKHIVKATAPGRADWTMVFNVISEGSKVEVVVPELVATASATPVPLTGFAQSQMSTAVPSSRQKTFAVVAASMGVIGIGIGTVMVLVAEGKHSDANPYCKGVDCIDQRGVDALHSAKTLGDWANLPFGIGLAGFGLGAALWFTAPTSGGEAPKTSLGVAPNGLLVHGRF